MGPGAPLRTVFQAAAMVFLFRKESPSSSRKLITTQKLQSIHWIL
uniref:Uncharacterized protein n=1 Tax=Picea sitchensis TaxID=3332 RepID=A9P2G6_PICSI|nr:unknown [Picea sitchensis]